MTSLSQLLEAQVVLSEWTYAYTLPETNIAPENGPSQKETSN